MSPAASTSARYSRIVHQYHENEARGLYRGLRLRPEKAKAAPAKKPPKNSGGQYGPMPKKWGSYENLKAMGLWKTSCRDPLGVWHFLMRGADVVVCSGQFSETNLARSALIKQVDDYLASMTLYSLPTAFYEEAPIDEPARNIAASREREA